MFNFLKRRKRHKALELGADNFTQTIVENNIVYVFFKAPWCGACKILSPIVDELADEYREKEIIIASVHTDNEPELSQQYNIRSLPTLIIFKNNEIIYQGSGMISKPRLQEQMDNFLSENSSAENIHPKIKTF